MRNGPDDSSEGISSTTSDFTEESSSVTGKNETETTVSPAPKEDTPAPKRRGRPKKGTSEKEKTLEEVLTPAQSSEDRLISDRERRIISRKSHMTEAEEDRVEEDRVEEDRVEEDRVEEDRVEEDERGEEILKEILQNKSDLVTSRKIVETAEHDLENAKNILRHAMDVCEMAKIDHEGAIEAEKDAEDSHKKAANMHEKSIMVLREVLFTGVGNRDAVERSLSAADEREKTLAQLRVANHKRLKTGMTCMEEDGRFARAAYNYSVAVQVHTSALWDWQENKMAIELLESTARIRQQNKSYVDNQR